MTDRSELPEPVKQFIREHISSVEQLEILLYLHRIAPQKASAEEIAQSLYLSAESVASRLEVFRDHGLLSATVGPTLYFALHPSAPKIMEGVAELIRCYRERRVSVINFIFSNPIATIQSFADAFIVRKKEG